MGTDISKRRRGRPPLSLAMRRDQIVGHVLHLEGIEPGRKRESIVDEVVKYHGVSRATVWTALREHAQGQPIWGGVIEIKVTGRFETNYLDSDLLAIEAC